jgi:acyl-CoA-binding protein
MHSLYLMAIQKLPSIVSKVDTRAKLTFYSLYKQINEGDADLFPGTQEMTEYTK